MSSAKCALLPFILTAGEVFKVLLHDFIDEIKNKKSLKSYYVECRLCTDVSDRRHIWCTALPQFCLGRGACLTSIDYR